MGHKTLSKETIDKIIELYKQGYYSIDIAKELNIGIISVHKYIKKAGYSNNNYKKNISLSLEPKKKQAIKLYEEGLSGVDISKRLNVSYTTVYKYLRSKGISPKSFEDASRKYLLNQDFFLNIDSEIKAYWLGFLYADGYITSNVLGLSISNKDKLHLEKFRQALETDKPINTYIPKSKSKPIVSLHISSDKLVSQVRNLGLVERKTLILEKLPDIKKELLSHFIRGYFDGDGCIHIEKKYNVLRLSILGTYNFISSLQDTLLQNCNITKVKLTQCKKNNSITYQYGKGGNLQVRKIYDYLYKDATVYLERKKERFDSVFFK